MHFIIARLFSRFSRIHRTCMCRSSLPLQHTHVILTAPVTPKPMYPHCLVQNSERCVQNLNITAHRLTLQTLVTRIDHHLPNDSPHVRRCCSWLAATLIAGGWSSGPIRRMATRSGGIYALQRGPCARQMWCAGTCKHLCARRQVFPETCRPAKDIHGSLYLQPYGKHNQLQLALLSIRRQLCWLLGSGSSRKGKGKGLWASRPLHSPTCTGTTTAYTCTLAHAHSIVIQRTIDVYRARSRESI